MEQAVHEVWEFENRVNGLRNGLSEIPRLLAEVSDTMLSIGRRSLSLAPSRGGGRPMPGGQALALLSPVADHATETDGLPHPVTVLREVADVVRAWMGERSVVGEGLDSSVAFVSASASWIVAHEELAVWVEGRLGSVLGLLRSLVGDAERAEPRTFDPDTIEGHMRELLAERPAAYRMTPTEADHFWPGIATRIKVHRSRARARARVRAERLSQEAGHRVDVEPDLFAVPDALGRYSAAELVEYHRSRGHARTRRAEGGACQTGAAV